MVKHVGRSCVRGTGRKSRKYCRTTYTYRYKLHVINFFANFDIKATVDKFFPDTTGVTHSSARKLIYKWSRNRTHIEASQGRIDELRRTRSPGQGTTLNPATEASLVKWINDFRRDGMPVSRTMLAERALEVSREAAIPRGAFSASACWICGFTARHRLSFRAKTHQGQEAPTEAMAKAEAFSKKVNRIIEAEGVVNIINADQTATFYEILPKQTLAATGAKTVWVKCGKKEKERMTAMVMGDIKGNKYPLFLVMKSKPSKIANVAEENRRFRHGFGGRVWKEVKQLQDEHGVQIHGNNNAWWTGALTVEFLRFHFGGRSVLSEPILLLLDDFSGHWVTEADEYARTIRVILVKVPPGLTWLCQPADAVWIKPMTDKLRRSWLEHLREQIARHRSASETGAPFTLEAPKRAKVTAWVCDAWNAIPASVITAGFHKCRIGEAGTTDVTGEEEADETHQVEMSAVLGELEALGLVDEAVRQEADVVDRLCSGTGSFEE